MKPILAAVFAAGASALTFRGDAELSSMVSGMGSPAKELEDTFLSLLGNKNTPQLLNFVKQIEELLEKSMKPPVLKHHKEEQRTLNALNLLFGNCSASLDKDLAKDKSAEKTAVNAAKNLADSSAELTQLEADERKCVQTLKVYQDLRSSTCTSLDLILRQSSPCGCTLRAGTYYADAAASARCFANQHARWQSADSNCTSAKEKVAAWSKVCAVKTAQLKPKRDRIPGLTTVADEAACAYVNLGRQTCKRYSDSCFPEAVKKFRAAVAAAKIQETGMKGEWESIARLQCLTKTISAKDEERAAAIQACRGKAVDTSVVNLVYPQEPKPRACVPDSGKIKCKTCDSMSCPAGYQKVSGATLIESIKAEKCCKLSDPLYGSERTCWGYGDPLIFPFAGGQQWQLESGKWMFVDTPVFQVSAHTCASYSSTRQNCIQGGAATTKQIALTGTVLEGNTILIHPQDGFLYFNNNRLPINTAGSWKYEDVAAISCNGWSVYINLKWGIRVRIDRQSNYLNFYFTMRRAAGYERGFCFFNPLGLTVADNFEVRRWSLLDAGDAKKHNVSAEVLKMAQDGLKEMKDILDKCDPKDKEIYTASCKKNLPSSVAPVEIDGCVMDSCARGSKTAARNAGALYQKVDRVKAMAKPLEYSVAAPGKECPANTEPATPFSEASKAKVKELLASAAAGSTVCQPERFYRPGALTGFPGLDRACSTGAGAMRLAMPKTAKAITAIKEVAALKSGSRTVWLGSRADQGRWVWFDGQKVSESLLGPLPPVTPKGVLSLQCKSGVQSCQWKVSTTSEENVAICESQVE